MRVIYFHQHFSTRQGSAGTRSYEFAKALVSKGHAVTMVCGSYKLANTGLQGQTQGLLRRGNVDGIDVIEICLAYSNSDGLLKRSWTFLKYALVSLYLLLTTKSDLAFATSTPLTAAIPGIFAKLILRKRFIFEVRDLWPELPVAMGVVRNPVVIAALSLLELLAYRAADACIALAPGIADGIRKRSPTGKPIFMIPNGCDLDLFKPNPNKSLRAKFDLPIDRIVAVFCGAHGVANGLDAVLDAAAQLLHRGSAVQIVLIGDGKLKPSLVARKESENITNVTFLDPIPKDRLAELLPLCDIGLQILDDIPEFYNATSPNKFFDYISAGLPVVTNYPGWIAELIATHRCGLGAVIGGGNSLADAIDRLTQSAAERLNMSQSSRRLAESSFDRAKLSAQFVSALEQFKP